MDFFNSEYIYLFSLAVILLSTKLFGLASQRVHMPAVVGALLAGMILGPSCLNLVTENDFLTKSAEIGVIILMFLAGLGTDLDELKKNGVASFIVASIGVVVPLIGGMVLYYLFFGETIKTDPQGTLKAAFVGVTLTATSVSITVETLREMGKLRGRMGTTILGAAIIDDIMGIVVLTIVTSMTDSSVSLVTVMLKIVLFFVFIVFCSFVVVMMRRIFRIFQKRKRRTSIYVLSFCFLMSFAAEYLFGVADITGAYFAGLIFCNFGVREYLDDKLNILSYLFFSPIFFASIGIKTNLHDISANMLIFALLLLVIAIATKIIGCGIGAKLCKFNMRDSLSIGMGMVSRGEVALIVAQKGAAAGLVDSSLFPPIVFMVIVTTLITPIMLKLIIKQDNDGNAIKPLKV